MVRKKVVVGAQEGITPSVAAEIVKHAQARECRISCESGNGSISMKSLMAVLSLGLARGDALEFWADGPDEAEACREIERIVTEGKI